MISWILIFNSRNKTQKPKLLRVANALTWEAMDNEIKTGDCGGVVDIETMQYFKNIGWEAWMARHAPRSDGRKLFDEVAIFPKEIREALCGGIEEEIEMLEIESRVLNFLA